MAILIQVLISLLVFGSTFLLVWSLFGHPVNTAAPVPRPGQLPYCPLLGRPMSVFRSCPSVAIVGKRLRSIERSRGSSETRGNTG